MKQPDFLKQELNRIFIEWNKRRLIADQIVKVFLKSGQEKWILIHIEVGGIEELSEITEKIRDLIV